MLGGLVCTNHSCNTNIRTAAEALPGPRFQCSEGFSQNPQASSGQGRLWKLPRDPREASQGGARPVRLLVAAEKERLVFWTTDCGLC